MKWRVTESREEKKQTKKQNRKGEGTATQTNPQKWKGETRCSHCLIPVLKPKLQNVRKPNTPSELFLVLQEPWVLAFSPKASLKGKG